MKFAWVRRSLILASALVLAACGGATATSPPTGAPTGPSSAPSSLAPATATTASAPSAPPSPAPTAPSATSQPVPTEIVNTPAPEELAVSIGPNGFFVGYGGLTLYTFDEDELGVSNCSGDCIFNWPPLLVAAPDDIPLGEGLNAADFATITREDGALHVTYRDMPLYFYLEDVSPGDTNGAGLGGVWHLINGDSAASPNGGAVDY